MAPGSSSGSPQAGSERRARLTSTRPARAILTALREVRRHCGQGNAGIFLDLSFETDPDVVLSCSHTAIDFPEAESLKTPEFACICLAELTVRRREVGVERDRLSHFALLCFGHAFTLAAGSAN